VNMGFVEPPCSARNRELARPTDSIFRFNGIDLGLGPAFFSLEKFASCGRNVAPRRHGLADGPIPVSCRNASHNFAAVNGRLVPDTRPAVSYVGLTGCANTNENGVVRSFRRRPFDSGACSATAAALFLLRELAARRGYLDEK